MLKNKNKNRWRPQRGLKTSILHALPWARDTFMEHIRPVLRAFDLTDQQWRVLRSLYLMGELDATDLAEHAYLRKSSLSRVIRQLKERKLLTRSIDEKDGRRVILRLTNIGDSLCLKVGPMMEQNYIETMALLKDVDVKLLTHELRKLAQTLEAEIVARASKKG